MPGSVFRNKEFPELATASIIAEEWMRSKFERMNLTYIDYFEHDIDLKDVGITEASVALELIPRYCPWIEEAYLDCKGECSKRGIQYPLLQRIRYKLVKPGLRGQSQTRMIYELMSQAGSPWRGWHEAVAPVWQNLQDRDHARGLLLGLDPLPRDLGDRGWLYLKQYGPFHYKVGFTMKSLDSRNILPGMRDVAVLMKHGSRRFIQAWETYLKQETRRHKVKPGCGIVEYTSEDRMFASPEEAAGVFYSVLLGTRDYKALSADLTAARCKEFYRLRLSQAAQEFGYDGGSVRLQASATMSFPLHPGN